MDLKKAFTFMFADSRWGINLGIVVLLLFSSSIFVFFLCKSFGLDITNSQSIAATPPDAKTLLVLFLIIFIFTVIGEILSSGYGILLARNCNNSGTEKILPDLIFNFKSILKNGGKFLLSRIIFAIAFYSLLIVLIAVYTLITGLIMATVNSLGVLFIILGGTLLLLLLLSIIVFFPALYLVYLDEGTLFCLFNFKKALQVIKTDVGRFFEALLLIYGIVIISYIILMLTSMIVGGILGGIIGGLTGNVPLAGIVGYFAGAFISPFAYFYIICVCSYIVGQVYSNYKLKTQA